MSIHSLRKRFAKDQKLPIQLVQDGYFDYFLQLFDGLYDTNAKFAQFLLEIEQAGGEERFLAQNNFIKDSILTHVKEKESFQTFNNDRLETFNTKDVLKKANLYHPDHHGKQFVSIDLKKANFHALRYYDPDIVDGAATFEDWMLQFTPSLHLQSSKQFRQVVFGHLNPSKQVKIQKYIVQKLLEKLAEFISEDNIQSVSHDEIVLSYEKELDLDDLKTTLENLFDGKIPLHMEHFELIAQTPHQELGFVKKHLSSEKIEFKNLNAIFMPQAYKAYYTLPLDPKDLHFYHEGYIASFQESIKEKYEKELAKAEG